MVDSLSKTKKVSAVTTCAQCEPFRNSNSQQELYITSGNGHDDSEGDTNFGTIGLSSPLSKPSFGQINIRLRTVSFKLRSPLENKLFSLKIGGKGRWREERWN